MSGSQGYPSLSYRLKIKYGLSDEPSQYKIEEWARRARVLRESVQNAEQAGREAAKEVFPDAFSRTEKADAGDIETLLDLAGKKRR